MSSSVILKVKCKPYLVSFLETLHGKSPISFPKNSNFNTILDVYLDKPPLAYIESDYGESFLEIRLPYFEFKDIRSYNYLSPSNERIFVKEIWKFFKITFRRETSQQILRGLEKQEALEIFIKKYNLSQDCWDMLDKDFQRYVKTRQKNKLFRNKKNSSVKDPVCPAHSEYSLAM